MDLGEQCRCRVGTYQVSNSRPHLDYYSDFNNRFGKLYLPTCRELDKFNPTLKILANSNKVLLRCAPVEVYMAQNLDERFHMFHTVEPPGDDYRQNCFIGARNSKSFRLDGLVGLRSHSELMKKLLSQVKVDFPRLAQFLMDCDLEKDETRDSFPQGPGVKPLCTRIDIGVGGQCYEGTKDPNDGQGRSAPSLSKICGKKFFLKDPKLGAEVRKDIGQLVDVLCMAMDKLQERNKDLFPHQPFANTHRNMLYGKKLRDYLGAKYMRCEWVTLQLKSLNRGDVTKGHYDTQNCRQPGYNLTGAICFMFVDAMGEYWSLKLLANSRKAIGDHLVPDFYRLYCAMKRQIDAVDSHYWHLMQHLYWGELPPGASDLTARNFRAMFLDDKMPWEEENLRSKGDEGDPINVYTFSVISAIQRDLFMSSIVTGLKRAEKVHKLTQDQLLELAIAASYQNSWKRYYYIMTEKQPKDFAEYYRKTVEVFGTFRGGRDLRYSSSGIDFEKVILDGEKGRQRMDLAVKELKAWFGWLNMGTFDEDRLHEPGRMIITDVRGVKARVDQALAALDASPLVKNGLKLEIGEFRLLFITQICALAGIHLKEHPILTKFVYIVKGTGGYKFLTEGVRRAAYRVEGGLSLAERQRRKEVCYSPEQCKRINDMLAMALAIEDADSNNGMDCIGCESQEGRREDSVRDVFMLGQNLYTLDVHGRRFVKYYGIYSWRPMTPAGPDDLTQPDC
jgi:hypothetical protein